MTYKKSRNLFFAFLLVSSLTSFAGLSARADEPNSPTTVANAPVDKCEFRSEMRKLWEEHVTWTRLFIVEAAANLPELASTTQRLMRNQKDIGDAIRPYYGSEAADKLTQLLSEHIVIGVRIVSSAKEGNAAAVDKDSALWNENGEAIATFLSGANPERWPLVDMKKMIQTHLQLTGKELAAHLRENWDEDIGAFDDVRKQVLEMSDMLAQGIIDQFPERFR